MQNRAAFLAVLKEDEILLVKSKTQPQFKKKWSLPGGVVNRGELDVDGAEREVLEETGIVAKATGLIKEIGQDTNLVVSIYRADYISGDLHIDESEILEATWAKISSLKSLDLAYTLSDDLASAGLI